MAIEVEPVVWPIIEICTCIYLKMAIHYMCLFFALAVNVNLPSLTLQPVTPHTLRLTLSHMETGWCWNTLGESGVVACCVFGVKWLMLQSCRVVSCHVRCVLYTC